jgi:hypothetical protein
MTNFLSEIPTDILTVKNCKHHQFQGISFRFLCRSLSKYIGNLQALRLLPGRHLLMLLISPPTVSGPFHSALCGGTLVFSLQNAQILIQRIPTASFRILEIILKTRVRRFDQRPEYINIVFQRVVFPQKSLYYYYYYYYYYLFLLRIISKYRLALVFTSNINTKLYLQKKVYVVCINLLMVRSFSR